MEINMRCIDLQIFAHSHVFIPMLLLQNFLPDLPTFLLPGHDQLANLLAVACDYIDITLSHFSLHSRRPLSLLLKLFLLRSYSLFIPE